jgi:drug/metabolite transporter (DMT)-like permease
MWLLAEEPSGMQLVGVGLIIAGLLMTTLRVPGRSDPEGQQNLS